MVSISGITSTLKTTYRYAKRFAQATPELIFGTGSEAAGKAMRAAKQSGGTLFESAQAGWRAMEKAGKGSFFKSFLKNCKEFLPDMGKAISKGTEGLTGLAKLKGGAKGLFKGIGSKLPFIGSMAMMLFELPNIFKATKEQGLFSGAKETVKAGARLTGGALGAAVGSAICPGIGSLIGWIAGEWLTSKVVGKSYTEKKAEEEQQYNEAVMEQMAATPQYQTQTAQQPQYQNQPNPFGSYGFNTNLDYSNIPYANDIMMQQMRFNKVA